MAKMVQVTNNEGASKTQGDVRKIMNRTHVQPTMDAKQASNVAVPRMARAVPPPATSVGRVKWIARLNKSRPRASVPTSGLARQSRSGCRR